MTNDFSSLDSQSDLCELAQVASNEYDVDNTPAPIGARGPNVDKLALHNMATSFDKRVSLASLTALHLTAARRGHLAALRATIAQEVRPLLTARVRRDAVLDSV